jgi:two-component system response regulator YesN
MYRVLIVDDEPEIRLGHRLKVDWDELGLTVAGEAASGVEALELLAAEPFDIAIVDMNMPVMNGVSLMEACRERHPHLKLLVVTGYEDFRYAKAAIKNAAQDYLLKPVSKGELTAALRQAKLKLDAEREARDERQTVQWRLSQYYKQMKEHFIVQVVKEPLERDAALRDRAKHFELEAWDGLAVRFVTAGLREQAGHAAVKAAEAERRRGLRLPFELVCREFAESYAVKAESEAGAGSGELSPPPPLPPQPFRDVSYPGLMHFIVAGADEATAAAFAAALHGCLAAQLRLDAAIGIGQPVTGFAAWKEGYLAGLLSWSFAQSVAQAQSAEPATASEAAAGSIAVASDDTVKLLQRCLARGELETFETTVIAELARAFGLSRGHGVKLIFQLYLLLDAAAHLAGIALDSRDQLWLRPDMALSLDTADKAAAFLVRLGSAVCRAAKADTGDAERSLVRTAQQFIRDNYMADLNLTMLAERFNYNPSYFSELFKSKAGKTFIQYLTEVRMAEAIRLLEETALSLWDIAELTGFSNASYFSSKFKRMYGVTPSDYRQQPSKKIDSELPKK